MKACKSLFPWPLSWRATTGVLGLTLTVIAITAGKGHVPSQDDIQVGSDYLTETEDMEIQPKPMRARAEAVSAMMAAEAPQSHSDSSFNGANFVRSKAKPVHAEPGSKLIKTYSISFALRANGTRSAHEQITAIIARSSNAYIERSSLHSHGGHFTVRIPFDEAPQLLIELKFSMTAAGLGRLDAESSSVSDVTLQYVDQSAKIASLTTARDQLNRLITSTSSVTELLNVQRELTRVQSQLDAQQAQLNHLEQRVSLSSVDINLWEEQPKPKPPQEEEMGMLEGMLRDIGRTWRSVLKMAVFVCVHMALFGLPLALILMAVGSVLYRLFCKLRGSAVVSFKT
eukprot:TRINITY_DN14385_c0_g1_i1.p1 TRINITY_DN14385_c0_g1~~TRINITY_DN14385_c0_g1_i1.p1  ORF type:complete len:342 (+),score=77.23 TRINITY_DN14385_c0_g1_i1:186-1211(+)